MRSSVLNRQILVIRMIIPLGTADSEVGAGWMCNHQIPFPSSTYNHSALQNTSPFFDHLQDIAIEMPFRMSTTAG
jgi:hypothetical protein